MADADRTQDEEDAKRSQTDAQVKQIEEDIKANQPLASELLPIKKLVLMYREGSGSLVGTSFLRGAEYLAKKYDHWRKVRGDGNCYYRAFLYCVCESTLRGMLAGDEKAKDELGRLQSIAKSSIDDVTKQGYDKSAIEMFHEELVDLFDYIATSPSLEDMHTKLTEENSVSEYCTWYLRVVSAAYLKADPDRFVHFLEGGLDVPTFCSTEVEPMGRECGMVQILALAEALAIDVEIEYLDGHDFDDDGGLVRHAFGPSQSGESGNEKSAGTKVILLYRPGHYDILY